MLFRSPSHGSDVFGADGPVVVYYFPKATGWAPTYGGEPTILWNAIIQPVGSGFGVGNDGFAFTIVGTSNLVVVVEACTNLAAPRWVALSTNALSTGSAHFSDSSWKNFASRFYRLSAP